MTKPWQVKLGGACYGPEQTLRALRLGAVQTLLVASSVEGRGGLGAYEGRFFRPWWFYGFPTTVPADAAAPTTTTTTTTDDATIKSTSNHLDGFGNLKPSPSKTLNP